MAKIIPLEKKEKLKAPEEDEEERYLELIRLNPMNEKAYTRLMILYRKEKRYKEELKIIDRGIKMFTGLYTKQKRKSNKTIVLLSRKLNKTLGLTDARGNEIYLPEPLAKWNRRKQLLMKKMK